MTSAISGSGNKVNKSFKLKRIKINYVITSKILSTFQKEKNGCKHIKTSIFSTSSLGKLSALGELVIIWDHGNSPGKCRIPDFRMKTMSLVGSREGSPRDISSMRNRYTCQQYTEKGKKLLFTYWLTNFNISENKNDNNKNKQKPPNKQNKKPKKPHHIPKKPPKKLQKAICTFLAEVFHF